MSRKNRPQVTPQRDKHAGRWYRKWAWGEGDRRKWREFVRRWRNEVEPEFVD